MYNLQQQYIEHFLHHAAVQSPLISFRWQSEAVLIEQSHDQVVLRLEIRREIIRFRLRGYWRRTALVAPSVLCSVSGSAA